ncbi:General transcription factor 3C polypeptide 6 [Amphibalanus amphitrite]|uniref:General transcription factor 3C polypeptide 6 n=1 Tax=Amphibalanus amphitrite TaxID=1232801 RepID=A0A6A4VXR2_AMPAM|nr:General transcription factor 3C polypeptide 6 [Amphibalanus amphitrite]
MGGQESRQTRPARGEGRLETLWLAVSAPGGRAAVLGVAYRPPDGPAASDIDDLRQQLLEVSATGKPIYLLGDVNLDLTRPDKPQVTLYSSMIDELGFVQLIRDPTHPGVTPSLIDHVLTNQAAAGHEPTVVKTHVSDHDLVTVKTRLARQKNKPRWIVTRSMRQVNYDQLCLDLLQADWSPLYREESTSIDDVYDAFLTIWNTAVDKHCPLKRCVCARCGNVRCDREPSGGDAARGARPRCSTMESGDSEYEEEEMVVLVELHGLVDDELLTKGCSYQFVGIDTDKPVLQLGKYNFLGHYEDQIGSALFLGQSTDDGGQKTWSKVCFSDKKLSMQRVFLRKKGEEPPPVTSPPEAEDSTEEPEKETESAGGSEKDRETELEPSSGTAENDQKQTDPALSARLTGHGKSVRLSFY